MKVYLIRDNNCDVVTAFSKEEVANKFAESYPDTYVEPVKVDDLDHKIISYKIEIFSNGSISAKTCKSPRSEYMFADDSKFTAFVNAETIVAAIAKAVDLRREHEQG